MVIFFFINLSTSLFHAIDPVPPNATVIFQVELLHVRRGPRSIEAFKEMDHNNDLTLTKEEVGNSWHAVLL